MTEKFRKDMSDTDQSWKTNHIKRAFIYYLLMGILPF